MKGQPQLQIIYLMSMQKLQNWMNHEHRLFTITYLSLSSYVIEGTQTFIQVLLFLARKPRNPEWMTERS
eukprot:2535348-Ditylum_brightwellii.AAC.1